MAGSEVKITLTAIDKASAVLTKVGNSINTTMTKAGGRLDNFANSVNQGVKQLTGFDAATLGAVGAVGLLAKTVGDSVRYTVDYAKSVRDVSRALGTSYEEASKLIQIADDLEVDVGTLEMAFKTALKKGVAPNIEGLKDLAVEYQSLKSPVDRAKMSIEIFGRAGLEMNKFLELSPEAIDEMAKSAQELGLVLDSEAIAKTEEYRIAVDNLNDSWGGLKVTLGTTVLPVLADAANAITGYIAQMKGLAEAQTRYNLTQEEVFLIKKGVIDLDELLAEKEAELGIQTSIAAGSMGTMGRQSREAAAAMLEAGENAEEATPQLFGLESAVRGVGAGFDTAKAAMSLLMDGIRELGGSIAEQQLILLTYKRMTEEMTQAQYEDALMDVFTISKLEELNKGLKDGTVSKEEWISVTKDAEITTAELNAALGYTTEGLTGIRTTSPQAERAMNSFAVNSAAAAVDLGSALAQPLSVLRGIDATIRGLPDYKLITIEIKTKGWAELGGIKTPRPGGQHGLDMIVPAGFPNDSFPIMATSGERVTIIPQNQIGGDTFTFNNYSRGAAALSWATAQSQKRRRLNNSMGG